MYLSDCLFNSTSFWYGLCINNSTNPVVYFEMCLLVDHGFPLKGLIRYRAAGHSQLLFRIRYSATGSLG